MCGIAGFSCFERDIRDNKSKAVLESMAASIAHRGPDSRGFYHSENAMLCHDRLSIIDLVSGGQPMTNRFEGTDYTIVYNGELYNMHELKKEIENEGLIFQTTSDTEVILNGFIAFGADFFSRLNGIFAFAIWNERERKLWLCRDRAGVKPLFYTIFENCLIFGSELKALFEYPGVKPVIDREGLAQILSLGPAKQYGSGVFKNIYEVLPGHFCVFSKEGFKDIAYWRLESHEHTDSYEDTVEKTAFLVEDAIRRQMISDVPICTFLSGGIDSSVVSAVCAKYLREKGQTLTTFSFDFVNNDKYFQSNDFQPSRDRPYVIQMAEFLKSNHIFLECENVLLADYLYKAVDAKDLPGMADVDSSLLYFCSKVKEHNKVALTGECADEIFGGYPWFHSKKAFETPTFPWTHETATRKALVKDEILDEVDIDGYIGQTYEKSRLETPQLDGENAEEQRRREISYLNLRWFMQTLLDRMDRTSMYSGLEARVPFADHRIIEYVWNVPWSMKCKDGLVKSLLRYASQGLVPDEILFRRKSPYPKSYDPAYENILKSRLTEVLNSPDAPLNRLVDRKKALEFMSHPSDYGKPWYGQLMAGPQMLAYLLQINYWIEKYNITIL